MQKEDIKRRLKIHSGKIRALKDEQWIFFAEADKHFTPVRE